MVQNTARSRYASGRGAQLSSVAFGNLNGCAPATKRDAQMRSPDPYVRGVLAGALLTVIAGCSASSQCRGTRAFENGDKNGELLIVEDPSYKVFLVVLADYCRSEKFEVRDGQSEKIEGQFVAAVGLQGTPSSVAGRKIRWTCTTTDRVRGTVVIDGQQFELAKGAVFLISAKDNIKVEQLSIDLSKLSGKSGNQIDQRLEGVADQDPRLAEFLKTWKTR